LPPRIYPHRGPVGEHKHLLAGRQDPPSAALSSNSVRARLRLMGLLEPSFQMRGAAAAAAAARVGLRSWRVGGKARGPEPEWRGGEKREEGGREKGGRRDANAPGRAPVPHLVPATGRLPQGLKRLPADVHRGRIVCARARPARKSSDGNCIPRRGTAGHAPAGRGGGQRGGGARGRGRRGGGGRLPYSSSDAAREKSEHAREKPALSLVLASLPQ